MKKTILAALLAAALAAPPALGKEVLTVYTYESFIAEWGPGPQIKANFEKQCDCSLEWVAVQDGVALLNRLRLEGSATKADVVLGLDNNIAAEARGLGLFAPHGMDRGRSPRPRLEGRRVHALRLRLLRRRIRQPVARARRPPVSMNW